MTAAKTTRINARLSIESARKVAYLERREGASTTEVVREAIDRFYAAVVDESESPALLLARAGFIGCADGPADLSRDYKAELSRSLRKKA